MTVGTPSKQSPGSWSAVVIPAVALAYFMFRPVGFNEILVPVIGLFGFVAFVVVVFGHRPLAPEILGAIGLVLLVGLMGAIVGVDNPGLTGGILVWLVSPVIFGLWVFSGDERLIKTLLHVALFATILLSTGILLYVGGNLGVIPQIVPPLLMEQAGAGFGSDQSGFIGIRYLGLSSLVALAPMWVTASIVASHELLPRRLLCVLAAVLATAATLVAGRNAIVVVLVLVPVVVWLLARLLTRGGPSKIPPSKVLLSLLSLCLLTFALPRIIANAGLQRTWASLTSFLTDTERSGSSESIRNTQADQLLKAWADAPFFGQGWGAVVVDYVRSESRPWTFELQYHMLLFQVGIAGAMVLSAAAVLSVVAILGAIKVRPDILPVVLVTGAAALAMIIANASNPYLQAPGHMWSVYLVLMVANVALSGVRTTGGNGATFVQGRPIPRSEGPT